MAGGVRYTLAPVPGEGGGDARNARLCQAGGAGAAGPRGMEESHRKEEMVPKRGVEPR